LPSCGAPAANQNIVLPIAGDVHTVTFVEGSTSATNSDKTAIQNLLEVMARAKNTGKESVQDCPQGDPVIQIHFAFDKGESTVFLYCQDGKWFLEQPYQGIYSVDPSLAKMVEELRAA